MFEESLQEKLKAIFDFKKVTFSRPNKTEDGEAPEQECLFIEVENPRCKLSDKKQIARVTGKAIVYASADKMPFGYFAKKIAAADPANTKDLFFSDIEANSRTFQDIVQRGFSFVYFFNSQYDPAIGSITSITTEVST